MGIDVEIPEDGYKADYITEIAEKLKTEKGDRLLDAGEEALIICRDTAYAVLLDEIKKDLLDAGVEFDYWYSEKENIHSNK